MSWQLYIPALLLGVASSFHCIGMCGPIALLLPVNKLPVKQRFFGIILYNAGRVATYALLGMLFGMIGRSMFIAGYQQFFSIVTGGMICLGGVGYLLHKRFGRNPAGNWLIIRVQGIMTRQMNRKGLASVFLVGVANGLLPCSMVYFAIAGAIATGTVGGSVLFMTAFGMGTIPLMALLHQFAGLIGSGTRNAVKRFVPYMLCLMGIALIMRGLNLDIPYLSPFFSKIGADAISCHN